MTCTSCGSSDVHRSRRKGLCDQVWAWLGRWPYRCEDCGLRFSAHGRYAEHRHEQPQANTDREGPGMAFRTHIAKPQAKIVVQAESHEQLNSILLALNEAVNSYQKTSKRQEQTASRSR